MVKNAPLNYETVRDAARLVVRAFEIEADDALLDAARAFTASNLQGLPDDAQKYVDRGKRKLVDVSAAYDKAEDKPLWRDYLDASYAELFLGVALQSIAPLESVYSSDDKLMYEKQYFETLETMRAWDFEKPSTIHEPEDHIACEWTFLVYLLDGADQARAKGDGATAEKWEAAAHTFKAEHMDTWMLKAYADIIERDDVGFYAAIANIARGIHGIL